jgi:hypothetical protein
MDRSLIQLGIADLEALFAKSTADLRVLQQLEHELQHRKVSRAVSLLVDVRKHLSGLVRVVPTSYVKPTVLAQSTRQLELHERSSTAAPSTAEVGSQHPETRTATVSVRPVAPSQSSLPSLGLEEACRILKVAPGSTWETIEHSRRELVDRAHPERLVLMNEQKRQRASDEAKRVNLAYATLSAASCGSSITLAFSQSGVV